MSFQRIEAQESIGALLSPKLQWVGWNVGWWTGWWNPLDVLDEFDPAEIGRLIVQQADVLQQQAEVLKAARSSGVAEHIGKQADFMRRVGGALG